MEFKYYLQIEGYVCEPIYQDENTLASIPIKCNDEYITLLREEGDNEVMDIPTAALIKRNKKYKIWLKTKRKSNQ